MDVFQIPMSVALQLDDDAFRMHGGTSLFLGALEDDCTVQVFAAGTDAALRFLAGHIASFLHPLMPSHAA